MPGPSPSAHQVLVYSGPGVSPLSLSHTILTLSLILLPHYTVQPITPSTLATQPWEPSCALLVIPGGRDLPFVHELEVRTKVTRRIREYVSEGGKYLGICAGAYFGSEEVRFDTGGEHEVIGKRDLAFFPGACAGPTYPGFAYAAESGSRAVSLSLETEASGSSRTLDHIYYNGGGHFILPTTSNPPVQVLARYVDPSSSTTTTSSPSSQASTSVPAVASSSASRPERIAAVMTRNGKGKAILCSVHFEYPLSDPPARDAISRLKPAPTKEEVESSDKARIQWAEELLQLLDLTPTRRHPEDPSLILGPGSPWTGKGTGVSDEDPALLLHPTHPSPIFVLPNPNVQGLPDCFASPSIGQKLTVDDEGSTKVLRDANDELRISPVTSLFQASSSTSTSTSDGVTQYLSQRRRTPPVFPPSIQNLDVSEKSDSEPEPPQAPNFHAIPKTIIVPSQSLGFSSRWTPLFNFETYWSELETARRRYGGKSGVMRKDIVQGGERPLVGDLLWYAETVTSTQTMLDGNPTLLSHLPTPLTFLASFQLSGRGRGSNIWLSPAGCLQFSILLTLPSAMSSKLVFIQYLMALAVCEAVDDDGRLGVRIKWPNDIYAEVEGVGGSEVGSGKKGMAKLGGILVNTNLVNGKWRVVIGTGTNVLNALPTTSLSQLHSLLTSRDQGSGRALPAPPSMEGVFARIMSAFELKWEQFVEEKGFEGFMDEYYSRWLHSDQEVTLTTTEPHTRLRIQSITPDYGMLRCIPIPTQTHSSRGLTPLYDRGDFGDDDRILSTKKKGTEYVDLQPDGNSFDLMSGLIKRKT